ASVKGPSTTVSFPPERRTCAPIALGRSPPVVTSRPVLVSSSLSFPIASMRPCGGGPELSADLTSVMKRIVVSPVEMSVWSRIARWISTVVSRGTNRSPNTGVSMDLRHARGGGRPLADRPDAPAAIGHPHGQEEEHRRDQSGVRLASNHVPDRGAEGNEGEARRADLGKPREDAGRGWEH